MCACGVLTGGYCLELRCCLFLCTTVGKTGANLQTHRQVAENEDEMKKKSTP